MNFDTPKSVSCPVCGDQKIKSTNTTWGDHGKNMRWEVHTVFFMCGSRVKYFPDGHKEVGRSCE
jgi:hypothetical protein